MSEIQIITNIKRGILYDDLWEPLKQVKKPTRCINTQIPKGSYVCYVVASDYEETKFADKKRAMTYFRSSKKSHKKRWGNTEINLFEMYITPKGEWIEHIGIA